MTFTSADPGAGSTLADPIGWVLRRWWVLVLLTVLGALAGAAYASTSTKEYTATTSVLVRQTSGVGDDTVANGRTPSGINLDTESQVLISDVTAQAAQALLKTTTSPADLETAVSVTVPPNSAVLDVAFTAGTPRGAQAGAQAFAQAYLDGRSSAAQRDLTQQVAALQQQRDQLNAQVTDLSGRVALAPPNSADRQRAEADLQVVTSQITAVGARLAPLTSATVTPGSILTPAALPTSPSAPNELIDVVGGALVGLLLGILIALLRGRADRRVRSRRSLEGATGAAVLLEVDAGRGGRLLPGDAVDALAFSRLRTVLTTAMSGARPTRNGEIRLVVTGIGDVDSTGHVTANLAAACARSGQHTVLVAADPQSSSVELLGAHGGGSGLSALFGDGTVPAAEPTASGVFVVPSGPPVPGRDLLGSVEAARYLHELGARYDVVLVETPPATLSAGSQALAAEGGAVLAVVERDRDDREAVVELITEVQQVGGSVLGLVLARGGGRRGAARSTTEAQVLQPGRDDRGPGQPALAGRSAEVSPEPPA